VTQQQQQQQQQLLLLLLLLLLECVSQLNGVVCNCDMTSFTGSTCSDG